MTHRTVRLAALAFLAVTTADAAGWKVGVARRDVTPDAPIWMAGYGARTAPSEGVVHPLWVRALAIEDEAGTAVVLVTLDVCGIDRDLSLAIRRALEERHALARDRVVLACSHTHCGPVIGRNLITMYPLDDEQRARVAEYSDRLRDAAIAVVGEALTDRKPATLARGLGRADFGVNRRNNDQGKVPELLAALALAGPNDPDVPVLVARGDDGAPRAIAFGYACHCTTLQFNRLCNDYAGFAQVELESAYPGATTFFWAGCGADQNPLPRGTLELAERHGRELASAVRTTIDAGGLRPIEGRLATAYGETAIDFDAIPDRNHWEEKARSDDRFEAQRARALLARIDAEGSLPAAYPYPIGAWRLGDDLVWIFLGGEVVVDYALRLKRNLGADSTWVAAYCNDVMAYIPTRRVWDEGGYEGGGAMLYYGLPARWSGRIEDQVIEGVREVVEVVNATQNR
jgi:hypothetical protein